MRTKLTLLKAAAASIATGTLAKNLLTENQVEQKQDQYEGAIARSTALIERYKDDSLASVEQWSPCIKDTVMRIASISKPITMAVAAKLWETGKLDIDAPVQKYVPEFPKKTFDGQEVTITTRQMVSHLSGIRHYHKKNDKQDKEAKKEKFQEVKETKAESEFDSREYYNQKTYKSVAESLEMFKDDPLKFKPGSKFLYSTFTWTLISAVIEGASEGKKFEDHLKEFFRFTGMHNTYLDQNRPIIPNRAQYYKRKKNVLTNVPEVDNSYKWAGGGILSTTEDLLKFANAMLYSLQFSAEETTEKFELQLESTEITPSKINQNKPRRGYLKSETVKELWTPVPKGSSLNYVTLLVKLV